MDKNNDYTKRDKLINDEKQIQLLWNFEANVNNDKNKIFVTFPYCYVNGRLHLGHAYTISKAEFYARFMRLCGYNVLFPFGFHGTGTPIVACANKLKESLLKYDINTVDINSLPNNDQIKILYNMNIKREEMINFVDPYYWLIYFPEKSIDDLKRFGVCVDYRRSFVTTNINPYYDSFIKWQFTNLNIGNYLKFGTKPIIYSPKDNQPCSDHDRSKGEGIGIKEYNVYYGKTDTNINIILTTFNINIESIIVYPLEDFIIFEMNGIKCIAKKHFYDNLKYQAKIVLISSIKGADLIGNSVDVFGNKLMIQESKNIVFGSGFGLILINNDICTCNPEFKYYEPEDIVISRSGDVCVVAITNQWFIDYSRTKTIVNDYIKNNMNTYGDEIKNMLLNSSNWIKYWPCYRFFV